MKLDRFYLEDVADRRRRVGAARLAEYLGERGVTSALPPERDLHDFVGDAVERPLPDLTRPRTRGAR